MTTPRWMLQPVRRCEGGALTRPVHPLKPFQLVQQLDQMYPPDRCLLLPPPHPAGPATSSHAHTAGRTRHPDAAAGTAVSVAPDPADQPPARSPRVRFFFGEVPDDRDPQRPRILSGK